MILREFFLKLPSCVCQPRAGALWLLTPCRDPALGRHLLDACGRRREGGREEGEERSRRDLCPQSAPIWRGSYKTVGRSLL